MNVRADKMKGRNYWAYMSSLIGLDWPYWAYFVLETDTAFRNRLEILVKSVGGVGQLERRSGIARRTLDKYRSGESDPTRSKLVAIAEAANVSAGWLADGKSPMKLDAPQVTGTQISIDDIRSFLWNICETYYEKLPRRTKPAAFADQCLSMFDYLLTREDVKTEAAAEVIEFGAEQLKRASGRDD